jgi:hypothetical protein
MESTETLTSSDPVIQKFLEGDRYHLKVIPGENTSDYIQYMIEEVTFTFKY